MPAGTEIKVLIPGTNLPQKTKETPYLSNHLLLLLKSLEKYPDIFLFYLENLKVFFHLLIYLNSTKAMNLK